MSGTRLLLLQAATLAAFAGCSDASATNVASDVPRGPAADPVGSFREVVRQVEERAKTPRTNLISRKGQTPRYYKSEHKVGGTPKWVVRRTDSRTAPYEAEMVFVLESLKYPDSESEDEAANSPTPAVKRSLELKAKYLFRENAWVLDKRYKGVWPFDRTPYVHAEYEWIKVIR